MREEWMRQLEVRIASRVKARLYPTTWAATSAITREIEQWAGERGLTCRKEVHREWMLTPDGRRGKVDLMLSSPSGKEVAVEIDHCEKKKSLAKLHASKEAGVGALWVRWDKQAPDPNQEIPIIYIEGLRARVTRKPLRGAAGEGPMYTTRHNAVSVQCPKCRAEPGEDCRGFYGQARISRHQERHQAFRKAQKASPGQSQPS